MRKPKVSVIIVTFNSANVIESCLGALKKQTFQDFEVIVVDNGSKDATRAIVEGQWPNVFTALDENSGFTGGNIAGLEKAQGEFIALLNPDTEPCEAWLDSLVRGMAYDPLVGICASKLLVYGTNKIDSAGDGCTTTGRGYKRGEGQENTLFCDGEYIFGACGGAMLIRRELINKVGFFDPDFFLIYEDADFSFRAQLAGWKCLFIPAAVVHHKVRSSIGQMSDLAVYYSIRNSRFVWLKNMPAKLLLKYAHHFLGQEIGTIIYFCLKHGKWRGYFRANADFFSLLPSMLRKRRRIQQQKQISDSELEQKLTSVFTFHFFAGKIRKVLLG